MPALSTVRWAGVASLLVIAVLFAANHVAARLAFDHGASVSSAVAVRSAGTAAAVAALLALQRLSFALPRTTLLRALAIGLVLSVQSYCLYSAVARLPVALALLTFNTFPILLAALSWLTGGERPTRRTLAAMPVTLLGLALALDPAGLAGPRATAAGDDPAQFAAGVGFALGASASFAGVLLLIVRWLGPVDGRVRTFWTMATVAVVVTAAGAVNNSPVLNIEPIASMMLAWTILGQRIAPLQIAGALLVVGAIVWMNTGRR